MFLEFLGKKKCFNIFKKKNPLQNFISPYLEIFEKKSSILFFAMFLGFLGKIVFFKIYLNNFQLHVLGFLGKITSF